MITAKQRRVKIKKKKKKRRSEKRDQVDDDILILHDSQQHYLVFSLWLLTTDGWLDVDDDGNSKNSICASFQLFTLGCDSIARKIRLTDSFIHSFPLVLIAFSRHFLPVILQIPATEEKLSAAVGGKKGRPRIIVIFIVVYNSRNRVKEHRICLRSVGIRRGF